MNELNDQQKLTHELRQNPPLVMTLTEAAKVMSIHRNSIRNMIRRGQIKPTRIGRRVLISRKEVERVLV